MVRVGVVGLGMMGLTHLDVYKKLDDVEIAAICDADTKRLHGEVAAAGNIDGQATASVAQLGPETKRLSDINELIGSDVDLIDICLPTDLHLRFGVEVLKAGHHLMMEKPFARTAADAQALADAAEDAKGITFVGHCMRFWPGWTWLREAIQDGRYGKVLAAKFSRLASHPGGPFYLDGKRCGGAALDLHVHDTDFVQFCFGMPKAVTSFGYSSLTDEPDHLITKFEYDEVPLVTAEGGWSMAEGFGFNMAFNVNFEKATASYDSAWGDEPLKLYENGESKTVPVESVMGYDLEIEYMIKCVQSGEQPSIVTAQDAANTVKIVEAETESVKTGKTVTL